MPRGHFDVAGEHRIEKFIETSSDAPVEPPFPARLAFLHRNVHDHSHPATALRKLIHFPTVVVFRRAELEATGVEVVPTFRTPHVTLAADDLDELVRRLLDCAYVERPNPYHVGEEPEDR